MKCSNCNANHKHLNTEYLGDVVDQYQISCSYCGHVDYINAVVFDSILDDMDNRELSDLGLSDSTYQTLTNEGITVQWLLGAELVDLYHIKDLGMKGLKEIEKALNVQYI